MGPHGAHGTSRQIQPFLMRCRASSAAHQYWDGAHDAVEASMRRVWRLQVLVQLRKLYRNLLRAEQLLAQPAPVYTNLAARGLPHRPLLKLHSYAHAEQAAMLPATPVLNPITSWL